MFFVFYGLAVGPLKLISNGGALRGRICCVGLCQKTGLNKTNEMTSGLLLLLHVVSISLLYFFSA